MFEDEFDNLPDDFADISGVDWARILAGPSTTPTSAEEQHPVLPRTGEHIPIPASSHSSTDYYLQDDFDPSLLAELDRIEGELAETSNLISGVAPQPSSSDLRPSHYFLAQKKPKVNVNSKPGEDNLDVLSKKHPLDDTSCLTSPQGKKKMKANNDILSQTLSSYEDELTCPICCDFYVSAHISNPCGHSFCGSCGREWHMKNKTCAVCRTRLESVSPMIPNIVLDNVVEKHIRALVFSGNHDWEPGGSKAEEWNKRKQTWRNDAREREIMESRRPRIFFPSVIDLTTIQVFNQQPDEPRVGRNLETDPSYEDNSDNELIPRPIRQRRPRRQVAPSHG